MPGHVNKCQMCGCECELTLHHLVPQARCKNKYKMIKNDESNHIMICRSCHDVIHAIYDETYLRDNLNTLEKIMSDKKILKFVDWKRKHPNFTGHSKMGNIRKRR